MSKLSFRARTLDPGKPMPIFMAEELPDLPDFSAINRAVPQMPTGMQKEEECEHHLQRAICAGLIIPTPEVTDVPLKEIYDRMYPSNYKQPRQLIHMQPFTMEQEIPDYDMDSDDEKWLQTQKPRLDITPLKFEEMMDRLEKSSGQTVVTVSEAKALLKEDDELIIVVLDYWLNKRLKTQHPLILTVRTEHRTGQAANNPYLAFRRRTEKMQTRKNRKNDEVSYEKMLKLRRDLVRAVTLLELVKRREKCKREFLHLTVEVFEKRFQARDFTGAVAAEAAAAAAAASSASASSKSTITQHRPAFQPIFHNHNQSWADTVVSQVQAVVNHNQQHHNKSSTSSLKDDLISRREKRQYRKRNKHKILGNRGLDSLSSDDDGVNNNDRINSSPEPEQQSQSNNDKNSNNADDEGPYAFQRNRLCSYQKPLSTMGNWPWCSREENGSGDKRFRFTLTSLSNRKCIGFARRRFGRGGRIILDRVRTDYDDFWRSMDFSINEPTTTTTAVTADKITTTTNFRPDSKNGTSNFFNFNNNNNTRSSSSSSTTMEDKMMTKKSDSLFSDNKKDLIVKVECNNKQKDTNDDIELLKTIRKDWLHFRPKTPPANYVAPCNLLPPEESAFNNLMVPTFHMEIEPLEGSSVLLTDQPFLSDLFELDRRSSSTSSSSSSSEDDAGTAKILQKNLNNETEAEEDAAARWRTVGVSSFTLTDAGGEEKINEHFFDEEKPVAEEKLINGIILNQIDLNNTSISSGSSSSSSTNVQSNLNRSHNNKIIQSYAYSTTNNSGTLSLLTSAQSLTLNNSHSANNIIEFPNLTDDTVDSASTVVVGGSAVEAAASAAAAANQKTANGNVRSTKNNLVMEVT